MNSIEEVWPSNRAPDKAQVERMYKLAYILEPEFFRREDVVDFGIDLHRLKEFGEVRMSKSLGQVRKLLPDLWERMDPHQRAAFIMSYLVAALRSVDSLVKDLERELGDLKDVREALALMHGGLFGKFPKDLQKRLERGLGRWGNGA